MGHGWSNGFLTELWSQRCLKEKLKYTICFWRTALLGGLGFYFRTPQHLNSNNKDYFKCRLSAIIQKYCLNWRLIHSPQYLEVQNEWNKLKFLTVKIVIYAWIKLFFSKWLAGVTSPHVVFPPLISLSLCLKFGLR